MKSDKELLEEGETGRRLIQLGYRRVRCESCQGSGVYLLPDSRGERDCLPCDGRGFIWEAPIY